LNPPPPITNSRFSDILFFLKPFVDPSQKSFLPIYILAPWGFVSRFFFPGRFPYTFRTVTCLTPRRFEKTLESSPSPLVIVPALPIGTHPALIAGAKDKMYSLDPVTASPSRFLLPHGSLTFNRYKLFVSRSSPPNYPHHSDFFSHPSPFLS